VGQRVLSRRDPRVSPLVAGLLGRAVAHPQTLAAQPPDSRLSRTGDGKAGLPLLCHYGEGESGAGIHGWRTHLQGPRQGGD